ncbi:hypothetical protein MAHJHV57_51790 [Mycobacterium avium subsp. hominissuis]
MITQLLLLPVAWYLAVGSHQPVFGIPAGAVALVVLGLLFSPGRGWRSWRSRPDRRRPSAPRPD